MDGAPYCEFSLIYLCRAVEASLQALRTDFIDLYHVTIRILRPSGPVEFSNFWRGWKQAGKIRFAGVSIDTVEQGLLCIESGCVDVIQIYYNVLDQRPDPWLFEAARLAGVGTVIKAPLARGLLSGKYGKGSRLPAADFRAGWQKDGRWQRALAQVAMVEAIVGDRSPTLAQTALRFVLSHPAVSCVIPGAKTPEQAEGNAAASAMVR